MYLIRLMSPDASAGNRRLLPPLPGYASSLTPKNSLLAVLPALDPSGVLAPAGAACSKQRCDAINNGTLGLNGVRVVPQLLEGELVANTCIVR